jgi:hypothetical protein
MHCFVSIPVLVQHAERLHDWHDSAIVATVHQVLLLPLPSSSLLPVPRRTPERYKTSGIKSDVVQVVYDRELAL